MPPLCKGRWHFRKKMTEGLFPVKPRFSCMQDLFDNPSVTCGDSSLYTREPFSATPRRASKRKPAARRYFIRFRDTRVRFNGQKAALSCLPPGGRWRAKGATEGECGRQSSLFDKVRSCCKTVQAKTSQNRFPVWTTRGLLQSPAVTAPSRREPFCAEADLRRYAACGRGVNGECAFCDMRSPSACAICCAARNEGEQDALW